MDNPNLSDCTPMDSAGIVIRVDLVISMCRHVVMWMVLARRNSRSEIVSLAEQQFRT